MGKVFFTMESPEKCGECPIVQGEEETVMFCPLVTEPNDCVVGGEMWKECPKANRPEWCPLRPVSSFGKNEGG